MDTQFHTPSLGDDILDLTDCEPQNELPTMNTQNFNGMMQPQIQVPFPMPMTDYPMDTMPTQRILRRRSTMTSSVHYNNFSTQNEPTTFTPPLSLGARKQIPPLDGTEAKGPISPYGHFFRDTACIIKQQNPNCSYQELTRIVSSMWMALDANKKNRYLKKSEQSKSDYFKVDNQRLQHHSILGTTQTPDIIHINLTDNNAIHNKLNGKTTTAVRSLPQNTSTTAAAVTTTRAAAAAAAQRETQERLLLENNIFATFDITGDDDTGTVDLTELSNSGELEQQKTRTVEQEIFGSGDDQYNTLQPHTLMYEDRNIIDCDADTSATDTTAKTNTEQMLTEASSVRKCTRGNCNKRAIINPDWEDEYCSNECVVSHCQNVFETWKANLAQS